MYFKLLACTANTVEISVDYIKSKTFLDNIKIVAFDVDGTLTTGYSKPDEILDTMVDLVIAMSKRGGKVAFISGSPIGSLRGKFTTELVARLNEIDPRLVNSFEVYSSGGAVRTIYQGINEVYDNTFAQHINVSLESAEKARATVENIIRNPQLWGATQEEQIKTLDYFRAWAKSHGEGAVPSFENIAKWKVYPVYDGERNLKSSAIVQKRRDPDHKRITGLAVGKFPKFLVNGQISIREAIAKELQNVFGKEFQVLPAGFQTIDMNLAGQGGKGYSLTNLINNLGVTAGNVLYIGDELGLRGNDREAFEAGNITAVNVGEEIVPKSEDAIVNVSTHYNVVGPDCTVRYLQEILSVLQER